ncbi:unnamed protein product [Merluccius merluccius]
MTTMSASRKSTEKRNVPKEKFRKETTRKLPLLVKGVPAMGPGGRTHSLKDGRQTLEQALLVSSATLKQTKAAATELSIERTSRATQG